MDCVESILYPIIRGDLISQGKKNNGALILASKNNCPNTITYNRWFNLIIGPRFVVQVGEKIIDYNEDVR